jgi:hypothetical protein
MDNLAGESADVGGIDDVTIGRIREELEAATTAAYAHVRMIAATASAEAKLSVESAMSVATARSLSTAFLIVAWLCTVTLGVWFCIESGMSPALTLSAAVILNLAIGVGLHCWQTWLVGNIGLPRTRRLLRQLPRGRPRMAA